MTTSSGSGLRIVRCSTSQTGFLRDKISLNHLDLIPTQRVPDGTASTPSGASLHAVRDVSSAGRGNHVFGQFQLLLGPFLLAFSWLLS